MTAPLPELVTYSRDGSTYSGALTDSGGFPVVGATVELQRLRRTGWKPLEEAFTDENGNFAATTRFKRQTVLRWEFAGDDTYQPFRGDGVGRRGGAADDARRHRRRTPSPASGSTSPGRSRPAKSEGLTLVIQRDEAGRWRRVARRKAEPRRTAPSRGTRASTRRAATGCPCGSPATC